MINDEEKHHRRHRSKNKKNQAANDEDKEIEKLDPHIFFSAVDSKLPVQDQPTEPTQFDPSEISMVYKCVLLCQQSYAKPGKRSIPSEFGPIVLENKESAITKIPYFIVNSDELNTVFLVCRGSYCIDDLITDLMGNAKEVCGGYMHQGVYDTATYIFYNVQNMLYNLSRQNNDRPIILTGHSLGAAVAAVMTELITLTNPSAPVRCICFAPPPTHSANLYPMSREKIKTFVLDGDFVPFLSLENVYNTSLDIMPTNMARYIRKKISQRLKDTSAGTYDPSVSVQLYPPGQLYEFVMANGEFDKIELVEICTPLFFDHLVRGLREFQHVMATYVSWVKSYFRSHT